jgi:hypothetical protein
MSVADRVAYYMHTARAFSQPERKLLARAGKAEPDGSYPIITKGDLENAIRAYGRSKNKEATKKHIIKRAHAMGLSKALPEKWED